MCVGFGGGDMEYTLFLVDVEFTCFNRIKTPHTTYDYQPLNFNNKTIRVLPSFLLNIRMYVYRLR